MFAYAEKRESTEAVQRSIRRNGWQKTNIRERRESRAGRAEEAGWTVTPGIFLIVAQAEQRQKNALLT